MDTTVKFDFEQDFLPTKRHKKTRRVILQDQASVTIAEPTPEDFPVAFIVRNMRSVVDGMTSYRDYEERNLKSEYKMYAEEIRMYGKRFYAPVHVEYGAAISTIFEKPDYITSALEWKYHLWRYDEKAKQMLTEDSIVVSDTKQDILRRLEKDAKDFILFDDKVWKSCKEPAYIVMSYGSGNSDGGADLSIFVGDFHGRQNYFNALERDKAIAYAKKIALERGDTNCIEKIGRSCDIKVLMPEAVTPNYPARTLKGLYLIAGPSGSGKTTIVNELVERRDFIPVRSYTDRPRRSADEEGYSFLSREAFDNLPQVFALTTFNGYRYGATKELIDRSELYIIDPAGVNEICTYYKDGGNRPIHVIGVTAPPSVLEARMKARGDSDEAVRSRLNNDAAVFSDMSNYCDILISTHIGDIDTVVGIISSFINFCEVNDAVRNNRE